MKFVIICVFGFLIMQANQNCSRKAMENSNIKSTPAPQKTVGTYDRLPPNVELNTKVIGDVTNDNGEVVSSQITTVEKRLQQLKARYEKNVLVDEKGKTIVFFESLCRGASAGYEEDQREAQAKQKELENLRKTNTVIVLYCDPRLVS